MASIPIDTMIKKHRVAIAVGLVVALTWGATVWIPRNGKRERIRERVEAMRRVLRSGDLAGVAAFVLPERGAGEPFEKGGSHYRILLSEYATRLGKGSEAPSIWIDGDTAIVVPRVQYHYGVIPGGDGLEMRREDGEWYFTGRLFID